MTSKENDPVVRSTVRVIDYSTSLPNSNELVSAQQHNTLLQLHYLR